MAPRSSFEITGQEIRAGAWQSVPGLAHGFSTRHVEREKFFARFPKVKPVLLHQVHSDRVFHLDAAPGETLHGDAMVTNRPGLGLVIKTADCLPVLLYDPVQRAVGAAHAGWRGTAARIAAKTVGAMRAHFHSNPAAIQAVIGPGIQACCYEVGQEVLDRFRSQFAYTSELLREYEDENPADIYLPRQVMIDGKSFLRNLEPNHAFLDLVEANRRQLIEAGLEPENIATGAPCTACRTDLLYSYRREGQAAGRLYALIALTGA